jgi:methylmalonyl-CoA/ethylmalonyl-CoA epimerase
MAQAAIQAIDNVGICTTDLARSVRFCQQLGFAVLFENERGVTLTLGSAKLFLFPAQPGDDRAVGRSLGLAGNPPGVDHISFAVDDVDALHANFAAAGFDAGPPPTDQDWGAPSGSPIPTAATSTSCAGSSSGHLRLVTSIRQPSSGRVGRHR